jgi:hypothetical protein
MKALGLEPRTYGLKDSSAGNLSLECTATSDDPEKNLASCLALLAEKSPDLALVLGRWNSLPEAVRTGIVAMVRAAAGP